MTLDYDEDDRYLEDAKYDKPQRKAYEVEYKVFTDNQIQQNQSHQIEEVSNILGLEFEQCAVLLRHFKWQKERLIDQYMDTPEQVLEAAGLGSKYPTTPKKQKMFGFMCDICCDDEPGIETFAMRCGHRYCINCYSHYVEQKIKEEGESGRIQCPCEGCSVVIDSKSISLLAPQKVYDRSVLSPSTMLASIHI